jgi:RNA polymerase sigma-70 factor (ECF subfamily)
VTEIAADDVPELLDASSGVSLPFARPGTVASFEETYRAHFRDLSGYCAALLGDDQLGVDLAQEAFTRLFGRFRTVREPRAWLFHVATNLVRDEWRGRARHRRAVRALHAGLTPQEPADGGVLDAVRRLPHGLAEVVLLHYFADLPLHEVARVTRRPLGTVKRRLHEARAKLHAAMGGAR